MEILTVLLKPFLDFLRGVLADVLTDFLSKPKYALEDNITGTLTAEDLGVIPDTDSIIDKYSVLLSAAADQDS